MVLRFGIANAALLSLLPCGLGSLVLVGHLQVGMGEQLARKKIREKVVAINQSLEGTLYLGALQDL